MWVKEMGYRLKGFFEKGTVQEVLPSGYIHTFLIRNPRKSVPSLYNGTQKFGEGIDLSQVIRFMFAKSRTALGEKKEGGGHCLNLTQAPL